MFIRSHNSYSIFYLVSPKFSFSHDKPDQPIHSIEIDETKSLNLECVIKGYPTPPIELFFENKLIGSENTSLDFENKINYSISSVSRKQDNGIFSCKFNDIVEEINVTVNC